MELLVTKQAAEQLGITAENLRKMLQRRQVAPPRKDASGHYVWRAADLRAARRAVAVIAAKK